MYKHNCVEISQKSSIPCTRLSINLTNQQTYNCDRRFDTVETMLCCRCFITFRTSKSNVFASVARMVKTLCRDLVECTFIRSEHNNSLPSDWDEREDSFDWSTLPGSWAICIHTQILAVNIKYNNNARQANNV